MIFVGIILVIILFFAYDSYFNVPAHIRYNRGIKLNSVSKFSTVSIMLLFIPYLCIAGDSTKLLNYYPILSICIFFIPLFILAAAFCVFLYKTFDKQYLTLGSEKDNVFKLLFILNIIVSSSIFSVGACNLINYCFAYTHTIKYVAVDFIDKKYHQSKHGGFYTYSTVLKEPLLDTKEISLKNSPGPINDKFMKIQIYNGAIGIPFIMTNQTKFVDKNHVPREFIANSTELKKELDENREKAELLEKGSALKNKIIEQGNELKNKLKKKITDLPLDTNVIKAVNEK